MTIRRVCPARSELDAPDQVLLLVAASFAEILLELWMSESIVIASLGQQCGAVGAVQEPPDISRQGILAHKQPQPRPAAGVPPMSLRPGMLSDHKRWPLTSTDAYRPTGGGGRSAGWTGPGGDQPAVLAQVGEIAVYTPSRDTARVRVQAAIDPRSRDRRVAGLKIGDRANRFTPAGTPRGTVQWAERTRPPP